MQQYGMTMMVAPSLANARTSKVAKCDSVKYTKRTPRLLIVMREEDIVHISQGLLKIVCEQPASESGLNALRSIVDSIREYYPSKLYLIDEFRYNGHSVVYWVICGAGPVAEQSLAQLNRKRVLDELLGIPMTRETRQDAYSACIRAQDGGDSQAMAMLQHLRARFSLEVQQRAKVKKCDLRKDQIQLVKESWKNGGEFKVVWSIPQFEARMKRQPWVHGKKILENQFIGAGHIWSLSIMEDVSGQFEVTLAPVNVPIRVKASVKLLCKGSWMGNVTICSDWGHKAGKIPTECESLVEELTSEPARFATGVVKTRHGILRREKKLYNEELYEVLARRGGNFKITVEGVVQLRA